METKFCFPLPQRDSLHFIKYLSLLVYIFITSPAVAVLTESIAAVGNLSGSPTSIASALCYHNRNTVGTRDRHTHFRKGVHFRLPSKPRIYSIIKKGLRKQSESVHISASHLMLCDAEMILNGRILMIYQHYQVMMPL